MPIASQKELNAINPYHLRLDNLTDYIRGNTKYYKPFPGAAWFTPSRMAVIHRRICRLRAYAIAVVGKAVSDGVGMEIERYYASMLCQYQFESWGGDIGIDYFSRRFKPVRQARSLQDWHTLLDFLSDRMFYWAKKHRISVAQQSASCGCGCWCATITEIVTNHVLYNMQTTCVLYGMSDRGECQVLGAVHGEASDVRGAVQQYQKAVGPIKNRAAFAEFFRQNSAKMQLVSCVPVDVDKI